MTGARLLAGLCVAAACWGGPLVEITPVGPFDFELAEPAAHGLSGIAYAGDDLYWTVSDSGATLLHLEIRLDRSSGAVLSVEPRGGLQLLDEEGGALEWKDREDLAFRDGEVLVANERCGPRRRGPCLDRHDRVSGRLLERIGPEEGGQLAVFAHSESNRGFEALAALPGGKDYWLAPERALPVDGDPASSTAGSPVRLQRLDAELRPTAQYVYVTDPIERVILLPPQLAPHSGSRVVGFVALPDGALLVLENVFQGGAWRLPQSRIRLYAVDVSEATDVSAGESASGLRDHAFTPVRKTRLAELAFEGVDANFEGVTLGPRLDGGDYALLLIRDNGLGAAQTVYSLRVRMNAEPRR